MRGKSPTCRQPRPPFSVGLRPADSSSGRRPPELVRPCGKSETCRPSAWPSHVLRGVIEVTHHLIRSGFWESSCLLAPQPLKSFAKAGLARSRVVVVDPADERVHKLPLLFSRRR